MAGDGVDVLLAGWIQRTFAREDALLEELRHEIARRHMPEIYISAEQGRLLQVLLRAVAARRVLEIGTLGGYSAIWMARALPTGGRLLTLEIDEEHARFARGFIRRAGLDHVVEVRVADARQVLPGLAEEAAAAPYDVVFIDADKESYPEYLRWSLELVRPGGLVLGDNAFRDGRILDPEPDDAATAGMLEFNRQLAEDPRLAATVIPVRDGLAVAVVLPEENVP